MFKDSSEKYGGGVEEGGFWLNSMPTILIFLQRLDRILIRFWNMATKSVMIEFQLLRTNQLLQAILTEQYINMD